MNTHTSEFMCMCAHELVKKYYYAGKRYLTVGINRI